MNLWLSCLHGSQHGKKLPGASSVHSDCLGLAHGGDVASVVCSTGIGMGGGGGGGGGVGVIFIGWGGGVWVGCVVVWWYGACGGGVGLFVFGWSVV